MVGRETGTTYILFRPYVMKQFSTMKPTIDIIPKWQFWIQLSPNSQFARAQKWACTQQNQKNDVRPATTQLSLGNCPVWSESSLCAQWVSSCRQRRLWSDLADAKVDLSLRWAHRFLLVLSCGGSNINALNNLHLIKNLKRYDCKYVM